MPDPERFGVAELDADGRVIGFEEKPDAPKSDLIPIGVYFLRPDAFDVIDTSLPSGRGEFEITDVLNHYIPDGGLFSPVYDGPLDRRRDRAVAAARRRAGRATTTRRAGCRRRSAGRWPDVTEAPALRAACSSPAAPGSSARATSATSSARRDGTRDHRPRQADLRRQRGEPGAGPRRPGDGRPAALRPRRHRRPGRSSGRSSPRPTRSSTSPPSRTSTAPSSTRRRSCDGRHRRPRPARGLPDGAGRPRFLQVSTDEVYGSVGGGPRDRGRALAPRSPYAAAKAAGELLVRSYVVTHGLDAVVTRGSNTYGPFHHPEKLIPLFITNAIDDRRCRSTATACSAATGCTSRTTPRRSTTCSATARPARPTTCRAAPSGRTATSSRSLLEQLGKPWSLVRHVEDRPGHDRRYAMDGSKLAALGWAPRTAFEDGPGGDRRLVPANEAWWRATRSGDWDG